MKIKLLLVTLVLLQHFCSAQLQMAQLFCDHAVLQRDKNIPVWGTVQPGEKVTIRFANQSIATTANAAGKWKATLLPIKAGGPYVLTASTNTQTITANDVLVGEVWICSGQSNMEFTVKQTDSFTQEKAQANYPSIRQFYVAHDVSFTPQSQVQPTSWSTCTPQTVENFTAVGYYFAKKLHQQLDIPIGLIHSSWGGSQIESWISKESFLTSETFKEVANNLPANWQQADVQLEHKIKQHIFGSADVNISLADEKKYVEKGYDYDKWLTGSYVLMQWDWQGIWAWRGNGYTAKKITIPANMVAAITTLGLAESYAYNEVYINGNLVSSGIQKGAKKIIVPANTWKEGDNWLVIKMNKLIEPSWYGVGFRGTAADFFVSDDQQTIPISVNNWKMMPAFAEEHSFAHSSNNAATTIYNSMIAPLVPYAIKGFLWYQGETNAGRAFQYRTAFPLLINDWRSKWAEVLDFYFVQLANYGSYQNSNVGSSWAELREAQTMALQLPKTGMAVTIDIGNAADIHPTNKRDVGYRLAANAFKFTYNQPIVYTGPTYSTVQFKQQQAIVSFKNVGSGLLVKDKYGYIKGFEIAGADGVFHYATASIKGNTVVVQSTQVTTPIAVRYAWADSPNDVNLFNTEGFPACPFRTDNWKCVTASEKFK